MMSNSEARKRQYDADAITVASANAEQRFIAHDEARAAGELVADIDTLTAAIRRALDAGGFLVTPCELSKALVAAGFGNVAAARREVEQAERRGAERVAEAIEAERWQFRRVTGATAGDVICRAYDDAIRLARQIAATP